MLISLICFTFIQHYLFIFLTQSPSEDSFSWEMKAADWLNKIDEDATIGAYCDAKVMQTKQNYIDQQTFHIEKPELEVIVSVHYIYELTIIQPISHSAMYRLHISTKCESTLQ